MSRKNVNFGDKNNKKSDFCKNKKVTKIDQIIQIYSNTLFDIMIMMVLDLYA